MQLRESPTKQKLSSTFKGNRQTHGERSRPKDFSLISAERRRTGASPCRFSGVAPKGGSSRSGPRSHVTHFGADSLSLINTRLQGQLEHGVYLEASSVAQKRYSEVLRRSVAQKCRSEVEVSRRSVVPKCCSKVSLRSVGQKRRSELSTSQKRTSRSQHAKRLQLSFSTCAW